MREAANPHTDLAFLHAHGLDVPPAALDPLLARAIASLQQSLYRPDPRADLSTGEAAALERAGFDLEAADLGASDPLAKTAAEFAALLATGLSTRAAADLLGVDPSRIRQRLTAEPPTLYGIRLDAGWCLPTFQLDGDRLLPGLGEVVARLDRDLHPVTVYRWFVTAHPDLDTGDDEAGPCPTSPRDWLRAGFPPPRVAELATLL